VFKTGKLKVTEEELDKEHAFKNEREVPGYNYLATNGYNDVIAFLKSNLERPALCLQAVETLQTNKVAYNEEGETIAAYGWKIVQHLGKGKDGETFWAFKYGDKNEVKHCLKIKSGYSKVFDNHSKIFNAMIRDLQKRRIKRHRCIHDQVIKDAYNHYRLKHPYTPVKHDRKTLHLSLADVCDMNSWSIAHTGFVFWDMGYSNGRNFMKNQKGETKWVDYGGAGMLRCPNYEIVYQSYKGLPVTELGIDEVHPGGRKSINGKESLIIGDSDFVKCQFLLNYEFWSERETTADLYSSILQVKRLVIPEITWLLPRMVKSKIGKQILNEFDQSNWLEANHWSRLRKFFNANT